jgi:uncharacterized surface protein with fasciclin (FAS1) repeats
MKASISLQLAAAASVTASVLHANPKQSPLTEHHHQTNFVEDADVENWLDSLKALLPSAEDVTSAADGTASFLTAVLDDAARAAETIQEELQTQLAHAADAVHEAADAITTTGHDFPDHTIYDLIKLSEHTTKFAKVIDDYPDLVKLLNGTEANHTLFVPVDEAFKRLPEHKKPSKEVIEAALKYHIGLGDYSLHRILGTHTLPTVLEEALLGDEPQRLRTSAGLTGVKVNFYSKIIAADIRTKNGVIHAVRSVLVPPPWLGRILSIFPSKFSTLLLAIEKTDFVKFLHGVNTLGVTYFTPTNSAWEALGPRANAFLFNTDKGLKYLEALLKYQIAANGTLYSDAFYDKSEESDGGNADATAAEHFDLTSLLHGAHIGVDIASWAGFREYRVNGFTRVSVQDVVGKNGVIQVVNRVLIPPKKHGDADETDFGYEISVDELVDRLDDYLE